MAQYDEIAEQYKESTQLEIFRIISHTMSHWIGNVTGRSVLDLACGEGGGTRAIKQAGAARVVGVDVSEEMIRLAREAEAKQPLGIEYIARAAQDLERIGEFDLMTATFLLHYSQNRDELRDMARAVVRNLRPGCRFVTLNENNGTAANWSEEVTERYGFRWRAPVWPLNDGDPMVITLRMMLICKFDYNNSNRETIIVCCATEGQAGRCCDLFVMLCRFDVRPG